MKPTPIQYVGSSPIRVLTLPRRKQPRHRLNVSCAVGTYDPGKWPALEAVLVEMEQRVREMVNLTCSTAIPEYRGVPT